MIKPGEIQKKARAVGVRDQQIEKDYILSWILQDVAIHNELSKTIVFKGGIFNTKIWCGSRKCVPDPITITQSELPDRCCDNETYNTCNCSKG